MKKVLKFVFVTTPLLFGFVPLASAHEAYVLDQNFFWSELAKPFTLHSLDVLKNTHDLDISILITVGVALLFLANYFFRRSKAGQNFHKSIEKLAPLGPLFIRAAIAASFFFGAHSMSFLGPELPLSEMPYAHILQVLLYIVSVLFALGLFTEIAALVALIIFGIGFFVFGSYLATYLNYLGEIIALLLFGTRKWSIDKYIFGEMGRFDKYKKYETTLIRIFYGTALVFAAITVKFLHPALTLEVINHWNLTQFHWLFPSDPLLVSLGAGLAETAIGLFIVLGFQMRLTILISLFYITLSLAFFRELVWPHLMLYGISFNLLVQPETFSLDGLLFNKNKVLIDKI